MPHSAKILVVGNGPVGCVTAIALAKGGHRVTLIGIENTPVRDGRTVALLDGSVHFLKALGLWDGIASKATPLTKMRIIDDTGSLFRTPQVTFNSSEIGLDAFGYNIELADLVLNLSAIASRTAGLVIKSGRAVQFAENEGGECEVTLGTGDTLRAFLLVGADGKSSPVRAFANINTTQWNYPQTALTAVLSHRRDHQDISTEFHTRFGAFTLVPLPGRRSSLVWMMSPDFANHMAAIPDSDFQIEVEKQSKSILGKMIVEGKRSLIPMAGLKAARYAAGNVALVGESAHLFPPIGAQGLNLSFRDASTLVAELSKSADREAFKRYNGARNNDIKLRTMTVDLLNRSLLADMLPVDFVRSLGLLTVAAFSPLRRFMMQKGAGY